MRHACWWGSTCGRGDHAQNQAHLQAIRNRPKVNQVAKPKSHVRKKLEAAARDSGDQKYVLRLYVAGMTPRSQEAVRNVSAICREQLDDRVDLRVIDIYQQPVLAKGEQIIAAPTLIKELPRPLRRIIGDMADKEKVLLGLDLIKKGA
jgi:circadian clock protein KaiB